MIKKLFLTLALILLPLNAFAVSTATVCDTDCVLLPHFNGADTSTTFTDSSSYVKTISASGNAQLDTAQQKFGTASLLLDGTGDYASVVDSDDWHFGSSDFTIDFWVRWNALPTASNWDSFVNQWFFDGTNKLSFFFAFFNNAGTYEYRFYYSTTGTNVLGGDVRTASVSTGVWYHIALVRSGNNLMLFQDGVQVGANIDVTGVTFANPPDAPLSIGGLTYSSLYDLDGWIDELRIVKGTAVWTSNFTPPSAEYVLPGRRRIITVS